MNEQNNIQLPKNWKFELLGKIAKAEKGIKPKTLIEGKSNNSIPYIDIRAFEKGEIRFYTDGVKCRICEKNDILLVWDGARSGLCGKAIKGAIGSTLAKISSNFLSNEFLFYFLTANYNKLNTNTKGIGIPHIDSNFLWNLKIFVPPLPEQHRIVAKIEELFSELDKAVENLQTARQQLKTYRQSVLKHAFEGKLTAAWRESSKFKVQSSKFKVAAEPEAVYQTKNGLPEGWEWKEFGTFISRITAGKSVKCIERPPVEDELGIVKVSAVSWGNFKEEESKTTDYSKYNENYIIKKDDFLFSRANTIELVGACVLVNNINLKLMLSDKILRFDFRDLSKKYALYYLRSPIGRKNIEDLATGNQDSMRNISQANINRIIIPFCPIDEQHQIVAEIEKRFSEADKLEESIETALRQTEALRQSILKKAFAGKLVGQDENKAGE
jgi:type I restriction enzyme S subunit